MQYKIEKTKTDRKSQNTILIRITSIIEYIEQSGYPFQFARKPRILSNSEIRENKKKSRIQLSNLDSTVLKAF